MPAWITHSSGLEITPKYGSGGFTLSTLVDGGRNQNGNFIGQVIGNDKMKIEIDLAAMKPRDLRKFLSLFDRTQGGSFTNNFSVLNPVTNQYETRLFYVGDRKGTPFKLQANGRPEYYLGIKANLIEV